MSLKRDNVVTLGIQGFELDIVRYTQIRQDTVKHLPLADTTDIVHACLEVCITTAETLQATAYLHTLLKYSYLVTMLRQDTATGQSPKSTTDDNTFHIC